MNSHRKIFPALLSPIEKDMLTGLTVASGISMCGVLRQLILREYAGTRLLIRQVPQEEKALARHDR